MYSSFDDWFCIRDFIKSTKTKSAALTKVDYSKISLVLVEDRTLPYSFFRYIFVNQTDYENGKIEKELLMHEEAHCL